MTNWATFTRPLATALPKEHPERGSKRRQICQRKPTHVHLDSQQFGYVMEVMGAESQHMLFISTNGAEFTCHMSELLPVERFRELLES